MDNINDLVNAAMAQWDEETNCGENDPAFAGEVGREIDSLVDGLNQEKLKRLLYDTSPIIFVEGENKPWATGTYESCTYLGKVVYERGPRELTLYDNRNNIIAHIDQDYLVRCDPASLVADIFDIARKEPVWPPERKEKTL